jgi:hypothetical protein
LITEMTLPEKLGQLGSVWLGFDVATGEVAPMQNVFSRDIRWPENAESSIVLLDNPTGLLPLQSPQRIALIGPCGDDPQAFFGCYSFPNHGPSTPTSRAEWVLRRTPCWMRYEPSFPVLSAVRAGPLSIQLTGATRTIRGERVMDTPAAVSSAP